MRIKIPLIPAALSLLPPARPLQSGAAELRASAGGLSLRELGWLAGHGRLCTPDPGAMVEEFWMPPRGGRVR